MPPLSSRASRSLTRLDPQTFSTPREHPKSKPFFDHILSFNLADGRIWFRNFQIVNHGKDKKEAAALKHRGEDTLELVEVGPRYGAAGALAHTPPTHTAHTPRMVLTVIRIFDGSFGGQTLYQNAAYVSPNELRREERLAKGSRYVDRRQQKVGRIERESVLKIPATGLEDVFA